jgi:hypothetical protein
MADPNRTDPNRRLIGRAAFGEEANKSFVGSELSMVEIKEGIGGVENGG